MVTSRILEALVVEYEPLPPFDGPRALFVPDVSSSYARPSLISLTLQIVEPTSGL